MCQNISEIEIIFLLRINKDLNKFILNFILVQIRLAGTVINTQPARYIVLTLKKV